MRGKSVQTWAVIWVTLLVLLPLQNGAESSAGELRVAAGTSLTFAMKDLAQEFEKTAGVPVHVSFGASGYLLGQILLGEPYDLFFSTNLEFPRQLEEKGFTIPGSLSKYAEGHLVLWVSNAAMATNSPFDMELLLSPAIRKIAIPNPKHAPYGKAAVAALENYNAHARVQDKLVIAADVAEAAAMVASGKVDAGFTALSLVVTPNVKAGTHWEVPTDKYPPMEQGVVILKGTNNVGTAKAFLSFVQSERGQGIMRRYGFLPSQSELAQKK